MKKQYMINEIASHLIESLIVLNINPPDNECSKQIAKEILDLIEQDEIDTQVCMATHVLEKWARRGMISGQIKEKYGTTRWYAYFGNLNFHTLFYPRHMFNRFKYKWMWTFDIYYGSQIFKYTGLNWLFVKWQVFCYRQAYKEVKRKYPKARNCIDHKELLD